MPLYVTKHQRGLTRAKVGAILRLCICSAVDGHPLNDALDYQFYTTPAAFSPGCMRERAATVPSRCKKGSMNP